MIKIFAWMALVPTANLQAPVTVELMVGPSSRVMAAVGAKSGVRLQVPGALGNEVIGIKAPSRPLREVMDRVARVFEASWDPRDGGYTLVRTRDQAAQVAHRDREFRRQLFSAALANVKKRFATPWTTADSQALADRVKRDRTGDPSFGVSPLDRFGHRLIAAIPLEKWVDATYERSAVFSAAPNRLQRPLGFDVRPLMQELRREHALYAQHFVATTTGIEPSDIRHARRTPLPETPLKVIVSYFRTNSIFGRVYVCLVDQEGQTIFEHPFVLQPDSPSFEPKPTHEPLKFRPETELFRRHFGFGQYQRGKDLPATAVDLLRRPVEVDPLSFGLHEFLLAAPQPAVIHLSDAMVSMGLAWPGVPTVESYAFVVDRAHESVPDPTWRLVRPRMPLRASELRFSRPELKALSDQIQREGRTSRATWARFVAAHPNLEEATQFEPWLYGLEPQTFEMLNEASAYRLFHALTESQKERLAAGQKLPLRALTPTQRHLIQQWLYAVYRPRIAETYRSNDAMPGDVHPQMRVRTQPTERFPEGLPPETTVEVEVEQGEAIFGIPIKVHDWIKHRRQRLTNDDVARYLAIQERPEFDRSNMEGYERYHLGTENTWHLRVHLGSGIRSPKMQPSSALLVAHLYDDVVPPKVYELKDLPEDRQSTIKKAFEQMRKTLIFRVERYNPPPPPPSP